MMARRLVIHPLNRGHQPVRLELQVEGGRIVDAKAGTAYYWDVSALLKGQEPFDALQIAQRSGGVDFVSHVLAAARALEKLAEQQIPDNAMFSRNVLLALDIIYGHITHFYQTVLPAYAVSSVWQALEARREIHQLMALIAGKAPHISAVVAGGVTYIPDRSALVKIDSILKKIARFVDNQYSKDLEQVEKAYPEYFQTGGGHGRFLAVGEFPQKNPGRPLFSAGFGSLDGISAPDLKHISIDCTGSKYEAEGESGTSFSMGLKPSPAKAGAYSWVKGAVYRGKTYETGALARLIISGHAEMTGLGARAASVFGRLRARLQECKILLEHTEEWLEQLDPELIPAERIELPAEGEAFGMAEASGGAIVHYLLIKKGKIHRYNILDADSWNLCPGTGNGEKGPLEQALTGLQVGSGDLPAEVIRVARSFI